MMAVAASTEGQVQKHLCCASTYRLKAGDKDVTRGEISEARAAYQSSLEQLSQLLEQVVRATLFHHTRKLRS